MTFDGKGAQQRKARVLRLAPALVLPYTETRE